MEQTNKGGILPLVNLASNLLSLIPTRKSFSPSDEAFLKANRNSRILSMTVCRTPLEQALGMTLNVLTLGKWQKIVKDKGYDTLFHLFLRIQLANPTTGKISYAILEKNSTPRIYPTNDPISKTTACQQVMRSYPGTLGDLIDTTKASMGDDQFFTYDPFRNNCQHFILNVLGSNKLLDMRLRLFIKQDAEAIGQRLPGYATGIAKGVTDLDRKFRTILGRGLETEMN